MNIFLFLLDSKVFPIINFLLLLMNYLINLINKLLEKLIRAGFCSNSNVFTRNLFPYYKQNLKLYNKSKQMKINADFRPSLLTSRCAVGTAFK